MIQIWKTFGHRQVRKELIFRGISQLFGNISLDFLILKENFLGPNGIELSKSEEDLNKNTLRQKYQVI